MEKRVVFKSAWLPYLLVAPQLAITIVFFFLPAGQTLLFAFQRQDAFGMNAEFAGFENFIFLLHDETYLESAQVTAVFSLLVAAGGIVIALLMAVLACAPELEVSIAHSPLKNLASASLRRPAYVNQPFFA